ncbi:MAG TPA: EAL domain-containing protein [Acidobacteriaceae bacterium]|nr:EAL domain-containing protein [Acidobacteriaceae bacterium]
MPSLRHRRLSIAMLALFGALAGAASGYWLGHVTLLRTANAGLSSYASDLIGHSDEYAVELGNIRKAFNPSPYPFCSRQEITLMQTLTFRSLQVKEIGRTHEGKFYCSAFVGRLDVPKPLPPLTMTTTGGTHVYSDSRLTFAPTATGTILEGGDVDVVLSPNAFDHWNRPHVRYMVVVVNGKTGQMAYLAGSRLDVDLPWILAQKETRKGGDLYRSRCSSRYDVCIVTEESASEILQGNRALLLEYCGMGGAAGFGLGLALGQFYLRRIGLAQQFRRALRRGTLELVYQPILELPSRACAGAEALTRWSDEEGNAISPEIFVRMAEDRGLIGQLTSFVVQRSIEEVGWILRKNPELTLSINIAASDLEGEALFALLDRYVRKAGIRPRQIALELTERSTADLDVVRRAVLRLHHEGYQIHIDDFGTGFSSLAYLHELAVDAIKVDRTFTRTIGTDAVTASILPQILSLAESLQLEVIVEGVETEAQAEYLIATGKRMQAQGWCFGKPVTASQLPKYQEQRRGSPDASHANDEVAASRSE